MQEAHIAPTDGMLHLPPRQRCLAGAFAQSALPFPSGHKKRSDPKIAAGAQWPPHSLLGTKKVRPLWAGLA